MVTYDLHVHTHNSDGKQSPQKVFARAQMQGVKGIVLTDHSAISYSNDLIELAQACEIRLLFPGVEISTTHAGNKFHVLAYGPAICSPDLCSYMFWPTEIKNRIYRQVIIEFVQEGHWLPPEQEMLAGVNTDGTYAHPTKWMFSKTLISSYLTQNSDLNFEQAKALVSTKYRRLEVDYPERYLDTIETIERIRACKALPVLAHPWWECSTGKNTPDGVKEQIAIFQQHGLLGFEVVSRHHTAEQEELHRAFAARLGLLAFAGSDYHADGKSDIGDYGLGEEQLQQLIETALQHGCQLIS